MCDCTNGQVVPDTEKGHNAITFHLILKIKALLFYKMSGYTIPMTSVTSPKLESSASLLSEPQILQYFQLKRGRVQGR